MLFRVNRGVGWIARALEAPLLAILNSVRGEVQPGVDVFGTGRWESPSVQVWTGAAGSTEHIFTRVPVGKIWIVSYGSLQCDAAVARNGRISVYNDGIPYTATVQSGSLPAGGHLVVPRPFVVPSLHQLDVIIPDLAAGEHAAATFMYHEVTAGEYVMTV